MGTHVRLCSMSQSLYLVFKFAAAAGIDQKTSNLGLMTQCRDV